MKDATTAFWAGCAAAFLLGSLFTIALDKMRSRPCPTAQKVIMEVHRAPD